MEPLARSWNESGRVGDGIKPSQAVKNKSKEIVIGEPRSHENACGDIVFSIILQQNHGKKGDVHCGKGHDGTWP